MSNITLPNVLQLLKKVECEGCLLDFFNGTTVDTSKIPALVTIEVGFPITYFGEVLAGSINKALSPLAEDFDLELVQKVAAAPSLNSQASVPGVKNIIAVASGKGGVGKSTVSVNLALALAHEGAAVGILDADIYGPSQSHMLGLAGQRPETKEGKTIVPLQAYGVKCISMGNLVTEKTPMIWRGPMVSGALQQLLNQSDWGELDYLVVDMPPGTGDVQLTLAQSVPVSGSVIVTTPQNIALLDARKGIEMFRKVNIDVLGVIENMAMHTCSSCGHEEAIFGEEGGDKLAEEFAVEVLGRLPLDANIREQTDMGCPPVANDPDSSVSQAYIQIARHAAIRLWQLAQQGQAGPEIAFSDD